MIREQITTRAQIFISYERKVVQKSDGATHTWFESEPASLPKAPPFPELIQMSENILDANGVELLAYPAETLLVLLPVNGAVEVQPKAGDKNIVAAGQMSFIPVRNHGAVKIRNPFGDGAVNYLLFRFSSIPLAHAEIVTASFDVNKYPGCLMRISPAFFAAEQAPFIVSIGKFSGRQETLYTLVQPANGVVVVVLAGAFEVQGRLLHEGDALSLAGDNTIEAEALSNDALLLLIELPATILSF